MLDLIVLHGEFSLFTVRGNFWYQIHRNRRKKVLCSRLSLITLTTGRRSRAAVHIAMCLRVLRDALVSLQARGLWLGQARQVCNV